MSVIRWKPKTQDPIDEFFSNDRPLFGLSLLPHLDRGTSLVPAIDLSETKDHFILKADVPGLNKEDITLNVNGSVLTIQGERKAEQEEKEKNYHRIERSYGMFQRSFDLGLPIDESKVDAKYKNGVLEIIVPKTEISKTKQIQIKE